MNLDIQIANLVLNLLIIPLLAMQWKTRVDLAVATTTAEALSKKLDSADAEIKELRRRMHDALNHINQIKILLEIRKPDRK